jgi:hypothetical protein
MSEHASGSGRRDLGPNDTLGHYLILGQIGAGGMGVVYRARDTRLKRDVALKVLALPGQANAERVARFRREAEAVAALHHPHIVVIYSIDEAAHPDDGSPTHFLTMELVEGRTLQEKIPGAGLAPDAFFSLARPLTAAVAAAHAQGVVHRDLKPSNVLVSHDGQPKVLDFGLAKLHAGGEVDADAKTMTAVWQTATGIFMGTPGFAAPEQIEGRSVDARADVFALGCIFFRMLTGTDAFDGPSARARIAESLSHQELDLRARGAAIPEPLRAVVAKALAKDSEQRYTDAGELLRALDSARAVTTQRPGDRPSPVRRELVLAAGAAVVGLAALALWWVSRATLVSRTYADVLPRIEALQAERDLVGAWRLARDAHDALPDDERVLRMLEATSLPIVLDLEPPGATFSLRSARLPSSEWIEVGEAPIGEVRLPVAPFQWRAHAEGRQSAEGLHSAYGGDLKVRLLPPEEVPEGMVLVPEGEIETAAEMISIEEFWIDRYEVTNAEYQRFVDQSGYRTPTLAPFEDTTGQPGPATWRLSRHGDGEEQLPVRGISWYEARAYCESVGKSLPTFSHWRRAAAHIDETLPFNNFNAARVAPVGSHAAISEYGAYDMAGNVREWVVNPSGDDRYVLGGAFNQPEYLFEVPDVLPPDARPGDVGVRCMKAEGEVPEALLGPLPALRHDFRKDEPIADDVYDAVTAQFSYDRVPFPSEMLSRDESDRRWVREIVSYPAPYGDERIVAHLYLPRNARPPYQAVVYFPGSAALSIRDSSTIVETSFFDFVPGSGRVLVYPIYRRMYERHDGQPLSGASARRDLIVQWSKEVSRTVDYLETREDIDADRLAFVGLSLGGYYGPIFAAMEPRFEAIIFIAGGLFTGMEKSAPEIHPLNHAPRITAPTLMVSGRWDFLRDIELEQQPLYDAIGLEEPEKRFAILDGGHTPDWDAVVRETLDWLDLHLGPAPPS